MKTLNLKSILILTLMVVTGAQAQTANGEQPTIIFVHGIWADGSCWANELAALQAKGYHVMAVQNPINSLAEDGSCISTVREMNREFSKSTCQP